MPLTLIVGPANAGKVELLLERYLGVLDREPVLIVPNRSDVDRVERDLLRRTGALVAGEIGTFDDLFERIARADEGHLPVATDAQRALVVRRVLARATLNGWGGSARFAGFSDALSAALGELESGLIDPRDLEGDLGALYGDYRTALGELGLWDRDVLRRRAAERVGGELDAWEERPVFAYGFEDLTGAQWALLEALAGRVDVTVSLPYEPGRPAFESLERTASDLAGLASPRIEELPPGYGGYAHPALAHLERTLFGASDSGTEGVVIDGAVRFFEGAGMRGSLELVGEELLDLIRGGTEPDQIAIVCPTLDRWRAPLETVLRTLRIPYALEGRLRLDQSPFGRALLYLLRFEWQAGDRSALYGFLRSPYSGLARTHVDYLEGRLRGRAVQSRDRVEEETIRLRDGHPLPPLELLRGAPSSIEAVRTLAGSMARSAYGLEAPPVGEGSKLDLRAYEAARRTLDELEGWQRLGGTVTADELISALERAPVRLAAADEPGAVHVIDLLRARTRRYEVVFVLGLEEGRLPQRGSVSPFLDEELVRELEERHRGARLVKADPVARQRYLFYTACTRPDRRLYLVREAATDDGSPREPSPFWAEVQSAFEPEDVRRWTRRRPLSALTWPLEQAPTERERLRAVAALAATDRDAARGIADANGWGRRVERALGAFERETRLMHPLVLEQLGGRASFGVTELEVFADCSSIWLVDRVVSPKTIDRQVDPRLRGSVAHSALYKFFAGVPKRLAVDRLTAERLDDALAYMGECLEEALAGVSLELTELQRRELEQGLRRDLEQLVRAEAESELPLVPTRFEVSFGSDRSPPELQRGLELDGFALTGKIDRVDLDPFSARGMVQDYKSGKTAYSAAQIDSELRLQIPLYMLVLRDLIGVEPLGGVYRPLAGGKRARGMLRAEAKEDGVPGFSTNDYLEEDAFWTEVEQAQVRAQEFVGRMRDGDVRHDPRFGDCPSWCSLWTMCRVRRA
ncbi:MAG: PD-(D/E)XK nuclease family protein [Actinomycetota bacterium]|nr:PD-(D/E)XK nuclease family protein [Actinomycetota bacterium]